MTKAPKTCALVLAGGYSKRFKKDKRLSLGEQNLALDPKPLILRSLENISPCYKDIFLVHRKEENKDFLKLLENVKLTCLSANSKDASLSQNLSQAMKEIISKDIFEACAIFLADMPFISQETINNLSKNAKKDLIFRPNFKQKQGHPVIIGKDFFEHFCTLEAKQKPQELLKKLKNHLKLIQTNDKGVITDIDYPSDYLNI